jgi:hypothetical protein
VTQSLTAEAGKRKVPSSDSKETKMSLRNEGSVDRALRVVAGLAVLSLVFVGPKTPWGWLGLVPVLTGLIGWCPLYTLLGMNTCGIKKAP